MPHSSPHHVLTKRSVVSFSENRIFWSSLNRNVHLCCAHRVLSPGIEGEVACSQFASKAMADSDHMAFKKPQHKESRNSPLMAEPHWKILCPVLTIARCEESSHLFNTLGSQRQHKCSLVVLCWREGLRPGLSDSPSQHQGWGWKGAVHSPMKKGKWQELSKELERERAAASCLWHSYGQRREKSRRCWFGSWLWELSSFYGVCVYECVYIMDVNLSRVQKWLLVLARNKGGIQSETEVSKFKDLIVNLYLWAGHLSSYCSQ